MSEKASATTKRERDGDATSGDLNKISEIEPQKKIQKTENNGDVKLSEQSQNQVILTNVDQEQEELSEEKKLLRELAEKLKDNKLYRKMEEFLEDPEAINLEIEGEVANTEVLRVLCETIVQHMQRMQSLVFKNNNLNAEGAKTISDIVLKSPSMKSLRWFHVLINPITDKGIQYIADALRNNQGIVSLNFEDTQITNEGAKAVLQVAETMNSLVELHLSSNQITDISTLKQFLTSNGTVTLLNLSGNPLSEAMITQQVSPGVKDNTCLEQLHLWECQIGPSGAKSLCNALEINNHLQELTMSANPLGNEGAKAVAKMLKVNSKLEALDLFGCKIGKDGVTAIAEALMENKTLKSLIMKDNYTKKEDVNVLKKAAQKNRTCKVSADIREDTESEDEYKEDQSEDEYKDEEQSEEEDDDYEDDD